MSIDDILDLCLYIATSAAGLGTEPKEYGPVRLLEVLSRLAEGGARFHDDPYLKRIAVEAEENVTLVMTDRDEFNRYLDSLVIALIRESKRRRGAVPNP